MNTVHSLIMYSLEVKLERAVKPSFKNLKETTKQRGITSNVKFKQ